MTSCRLVYRINIAQSANRPHTWRNGGGYVTRDVCQLTYGPSQSSISTCAIIISGNLQLHIVQQYLVHKWKANWIGHMLRRNCLLQRVTEGKIQGGIEVTGRQGRRRRKLLDDLKERRGYSPLKEEALDVESSLWKRLWTCRKTDY